MKRCSFCGQEKHRESLVVKTVLVHSTTVISMGGSPLALFQCEACARQVAALLGLQRFREPDFDRTSHRTTAIAAVDESNKMAVSSKG